MANFKARLTAAALFSSAALIATSTMAATNGRQQLHFYVTPVKGDPRWTLSGVSFQKQGTCVTSSAPAASTAWPVPAATVLSSGTATAVLFNPGPPQPDGTYGSGADDGLDTLYIPLDIAPNGKTMICRGAILANGQDVTLAAPGAVVSDTYGHIGVTGPLTVKVAIDPVKLATVPRRSFGVTPPPPTPKVLLQGSADFTAGKDAFNLPGGLKYGSSDLQPGDFAFRYPYVDGFNGSVPTANFTLQTAYGVTAGPSSDTSPAAPSYVTCKAATKTAGGFAVTLKQGEVKAFCVQAADGKMAEIFVVVPNLDIFEKSLDVPIKYTIWDKP